MKVTEIFIGTSFTRDKGTSLRTEGLYCSPDVSTNLVFLKLTYLPVSVPVLVIHAEQVTFLPER
jgi:hypothetical protein